MAKKDKTPSNRPTRKQVARSKKEQEQLRLFYMGLGLVGILIVIVLAFGLLQSYVIEPNATAASVNGQDISNGEYWARLPYERFLLLDSLRQIEAEVGNLPPSDEDDQFSQMIRNQYIQLANQISQQLGVVDRQTLDTMIADTLVETEAQSRDLTVSEDEITEAINRFVAGKQGALTAQSAQETSTARAEASVTAAFWTPTPTPTFVPPPTLETTEELTPTATPANTPTPAPTPTLNVITPGDLSTQYTNWLNTLADEADLDEATYRQFIKFSVLRNKLRDALADETPNVAEQSHARHILVETEEEANKVIDRLAKGEDFAELAEELTLDTGSGANGGDLDFASRGRFVPAVDDAVFTLPLGQISEPIETQFGWHVIEVLEREERELSPADYSQQQRAAFSAWLDEAREAAEIEDYWTPNLAANR